MIDLLDLPEEIIGLILCELQRARPENHSPRTKPLYQPCLTSKALLPHSQELLYSEFKCDTETQTWRIRAFLRTITANPILAPLVKKLSLHRWRTWNRNEIRYDVQRQYDQTSARSSMKVSRRAIRNLSLSDKTFWREAVRKDIDDVFVALLLLSLPKLKTLELYAFPKVEILARALEHATLIWPNQGSGSGLLELTEVFYDVCGSSTPGSTHDLVPFFRLPRIQTIRTGFDLTSAAPWPYMLPSPALTCLEFDINNIRPDVLAALLSCTPNLERFSHSYRECWNYPSNGFQPQKFGQAISIVAPSLRELSLDVTYIGLLDMRILTSLTSFHRLQCLDIELRLLLKGPNFANIAELLPSCLKSVYLSHNDRHLYCPEYDLLLSQLKTLADAKRSSLSNLVKIGGKGRNRSRWIRDHKLSFYELLKACAETKVAIDIDPGA